MTTTVGNNIVDRRLLAAGVPKFSPHDLRATSTTILAGLLDLFQTMDWAGHEDANTTRGYVVTANNLAQEIAAKLSVPHFSEQGQKSRLTWKSLAHSESQSQGEALSPESVTSPSEVGKPGLGQA